MKKIFIIFLFFTENVISQTILKNKNIELNFQGEYRFLGERISSMEVNVLSKEYPYKFLQTEGFFEHRFRIGGGITFTAPEGVVKKAGFNTEFDALENLLWTNAENREVLQLSKKPRIEEDAFSIKNSRINKLYAFIITPSFIIKAGRLKSHFGLGLLSNAGEEDEERLYFGYKSYGDIFERAQITFFPLVFTKVENKNLLTLSFIADRVVRDVLADREEEDDAYQFIGVLRASTSIFDGGIYYLWRKQLNFLDDETKLNVLDFYLKYKKSFRSLSLFFDTEFVFAFGRTEVSRNINFPQGEDVDAMGFVIDSGIEHKIFKISLEGGYASGDRNPYDGVFKTFSFNPDYNVGLIMFEEYLKVQSAISAYNASLPQYQMQPPRGYRKIPTNGSIQNAIYFHPKILFKPLKDTEILCGFLKARSDKPYTDLFLSAINGGTPLGPMGAKNKKDLGWEIDISLSYEKIFKPLKIKGVFDFGYFQPGEVFYTSLGGKPNPVTMVRGRLHIFW